MTYVLQDIDEKTYVEKYGLTKLAAKLIASSHLDETQINQLINPEPLTTSHAECVQKACERIMYAKQNHEKVFVGGDYDADGICSTAIMKKTLDILGVENGFYIPDRFKEGYGLSAKTVELAYQKGYRLIITVDNGVKAFEAIAKAHELGITIIVTDHHMIEEEVNADIVVHPDYMEETYRTLSGAGVALEISRNLIGNQDDLTAFACVAAIGDVMPLWEETRRIVSAGIRLLQQGKPESICALFTPGSQIDETSIAFQVVPKLNAVARMNDISNVNNVVKYLLTTNPRVITDFSVQLNQVNQSRKNLSQSMLRKAEKQVTDSKDFLIVYDSDFHAGIVGLVAGRIANHYHRPTIVMADNKDLITGSARSVEGFNMYEFFQDFTCLEAFGGHAMAAGLSIQKDNFQQFCTEVEEKMQNMHFTYEEPDTPVIQIHSSDMTIDNIMGLSVLSPWPKELPQPIFAISDLHEESFMDRPKIKKYHYANHKDGFDALIFSTSQIEIPEEIHTVIGKVSLNRWQGRISCQLLVDAIL